ncbi:MAG: PTS sugar transporter subunit IIA [Luteimonas sp.]
MPYIDLLAADRIVMLVEPDPRDAVLDAAARLLSGGTPMANQQIASGLRAREQLASTGIGHGVALPHCRSNAFVAARGAFLRLSVPIDFAASDGRPVDLVFALCVPEDMERQHLRTLAEIGDWFSDAGFREALRDADDIAALRRALLAPRLADPWCVPAA